MPLQLTQGQRVVIFGRTSRAVPMKISCDEKWKFSLITADIRSGRVSRTTYNILHDVRHDEYNSRCHTRTTV